MLIPSIDTNIFGENEENNNGNSFLDIGSSEINGSIIASTTTKNASR